MSQASFCWRHNGRNMANDCLGHHPYKVRMGSLKFRGFNANRASPGTIQGEEHECHSRHQQQERKQCGHNNVQGRQHYGIQGRRRCANPSRQGQGRRMLSRSQSDPLRCGRNAPQTYPCRCSGPYSVNVSDGTDLFSPPSAEFCRKGPLQGNHRAVMDYLFDHVDEITRQTKEITQGSNTEGTTMGIQSVTTSANANVAHAIQTHVEQMKDLHRAIRPWDPLFNAVAQHHSDMFMNVEYIDGGVRVQTTGSTPCAIALAKAHTNVVSKFVQNGWKERPKEHEVPSACAGINNTSK